MSPKTEASPDTGAGAGASDAPDGTTGDTSSTSTPAPSTEADPAARPRHETPADVVAALQEAPTATGRRSTTAGRTKRARGSTTGVTDLSADELRAETGIAPELLAGLEQFGLIESWNRGGEAVYGADAIEIARLAVRYAEMGIEPRHLRMYKVAAEREAGFVEQLAMPFLKQRNPAARTQAADLAEELISLGADLHSVLLRRELGSDLGR